MVRGGGYTQGQLHRRQSELEGLQADYTARQRACRSV